MKNIAKEVGKVLAFVLLFSFLQHNKERLGINRLADQLTAFLSNHNESPYDNTIYQRIDTVGHSVFIYHWIERKPGPQDDERSMVVIDDYHAYEKKPWPDKNAFMHIYNSAQAESSPPNPSPFAIQYRKANDQSNNGTDAGRSGGSISYGYGKSLSAPVKHASSPRNKPAKRPYKLLLIQSYLGDDKPLEIRFVRASTGGFVQKKPTVQSLQEGESAQYEQYWYKRDNDSLIVEPAFR